MKNTMLMAAILAVPMTAGAQSLSHNYVNTTRSTYKSHIFVSQAIEGEYGDFKNEGEPSAAAIGTGHAKWQGYNTTSTLGLELMKFVQFNVFHSSVKMRNVRTGLEHLDGSRFGGGVRLVFLAPVANLELGGGVIGTRYDYQKDLETGDFYGSGFYYSLGMNYFITEQVSAFGTAKLISEHSVKSGGSSKIDTISSAMTNLGVGFSLWL